MKFLKSKKIFFIVVALILFVIFLSLYVNYKKTNAEDEFENPFGWFWNNIIGWGNSNCLTQYGSDTTIGDYCAIGATKVLDVGFDSNDVYFSGWEWRVKDNSGANHNGLFYGMTKDNLRNKTGDSNFDNSIYFVGETTLKNNFITFGIHSDFLPDNFSISLSFKLLEEDAYPSRQTLFSNGSFTDGMNYECYVEKVSAQKILKCKIGNSSVLNFDTAVSFDKWYNLTITYEPGAFWMYVNDGENNFVTSTNANISTQNKELLLGVRYYSPGTKESFFQGELDNFRFFSEKLTDDEVLHNISHNSRYWINVDNVSGDIQGWAWSSNLGWICFGGTCGTSGFGTTPPYGSLENTKINWTGNQPQGIYPHMITGWAGVSSTENADWISLQGPSISSVTSSYRNCISCGPRDEEPFLVAYYKFDENSGYFAMDSSGKNYTGRLRDFENDPWKDENCKIDSCLTFDEDSSITISPTEQLGTSDFSIEAWVKADEAMKENGLSSLISSAENWELVLKDSGDEDVVFIFTFKGKEIIGVMNREEFYDNAWHHTFVSLDRNGEGKIYFDTRLIGSESIADLFELDVQDEAWFVGQKINTKSWVGNMDIVRIYKKTFSAEEVINNFNNPEKKFCSGCFVYPEGGNVGQNNICYECQKCQLGTIENENETKCDICSSCRKYGLIFDTNSGSISGYAWAGKNIGYIEFGPNESTGIYKSYVSGKYGSIYSRSDIGSSFSIAPPTGYYNSSYLIQAGGRLVNWASEQATATSPYNPNFALPNFNPDRPWLNYFGNPRGYTAPIYNYPKASNDYGNALGNINFDYLNSRTQLRFPFMLATPEQPSFCLNGGVYKASTSITLGENGNDGFAYTFQNKQSGCDFGAGTIIIEGDLNIGTTSEPLANITYEAGEVDGSSSGLASVAWIILGYLNIHPSTTKLAGTFIALGDPHVLSCGLDLNNPTPHCGTIRTGVGDQQLKVSGQFMARNFLFQRTYRDELKNPSELIIYDGRNLINTPPGLGDVLKSLPRWD